MVQFNEKERKHLNEVHDAISALHEEVMRRVSPRDDCEPKKFAEVSEAITFQLLDHFSPEPTFEAIKTWLVFKRNNPSIISDLEDFLKSLREMK